MAGWSVFDTHGNWVKRRSAQIYNMSSRVGEFFWDICPKLPGFEEREGQQDMSFEILEALRHDQHIVIEAGVGIGKSYAYLVPLLLYNYHLRQPVVVATSTIALQEQLLDDVTDLQQQLGINQEVILAKGQTNYLCQKRAEEYLKGPGAEMAEELGTFIEQGCQDRADFPGSLPSDIWGQMNINRFNTTDCRTCRLPCSYRKMREKLLVTDGVILCNQGFLTSHLMKLTSDDNGLINEKVEILVIDEAHNLESRVRDATTRNFSRQNICRLINQAQHDMMPTERFYTQYDAEDAEEAVSVFFRLLENQVQQQIANSTRDMKYADRFFFRNDEASLAALSDMAKKLDRLSKNLQIYSSFNTRPNRRAPVADDFFLTADTIHKVVSDMERHLLWIERRSGHVEFVCCPKDTRDIIHRLYFDGVHRVVLTSATLTNTAQGSERDKYSYFINSTGFPENGVLSVPKPSPFPYDAHTMLYYCGDLPHPQKEHDEFIRQGVDRLVSILNISSGKALVLFTSKADMAEVYEILQQRDLPYRILKQQPGSTQDRVLSEFRLDVNSVLLGTGTLWEGIDIRGKSLSNLVVFRLPFPLPDPIVTYKESLAENGLMDVLVPEMIIKLKQGIGRLVRSATDTGIVSIIDPRLGDSSTAKYRDITWEALPIKNRTTSIDELRAFYDVVSSPAAED